MIFYLLTKETMEKLLNDSISLTLSGHLISKPDNFSFKTLTRDPAKALFFQNKSKVMMQKVLRLFQK